MKWSWMFGVLAGACILTSGAANVVRASYFLHVGIAVLIHLCAC